MIAISCSGIILIKYVNEMLFLLCIQLYFTYIKYRYSSNKYDKLLNFKFLRLVVKYQYNNHFCSFNVTNMCNNKLL